MLKIKFNINEFTIIFLRRFEGKNERKRIFFSVFSASTLLFASALFSFVLCSALFLSFLLFQPSFLFLFSAFFFFVCFSTPFLVKRLLFVVFLQPYVFKGQPKKPKTFCFKSPNVLLLLVQPLFSVPALFLFNFFPCQLLRP